MRRHRPYELAIKEKLEHLQGPDTELLWSEMKTILDNKMPAQKKRRRFLLWLLPILALGVGSFLAYRVLDNKKTNTSAAISGTKTGQTLTNSSNKVTEVSQQNEIINFSGDDKEADRFNDPLLIGTTGNPGFSEQKPNRGLHASKENQIFETAINNIQADSKPDYSINDFNSLYTGEKTDNKSNRYSDAGNKNLYRTPAALTAWNKKGLNSKKLTQHALPENHLSSDYFKRNHLAEKGWVAGLSLSYNLPVSQQEMSTVNINGKRNKLFDYLPAVYAQYHLNNKWYLQGEFQFNSPQYTPDLTLSSKTKEISAIKKEENTLNLNKLYYLNIPFSVYYNPIPNLHIGTGIQYSYLQRSLYTEELITWEKGINGWEKTKTEKNTVAISNSTKTKKTVTNNGNGTSNGNGNGNGNGNNGGVSPGTAAPVTIVDTVAQSLKSSDWRILLDANYDLKRFNIGVRYNLGLNNYINTKIGNSSIPVQDRNKSFQVYIRYNLFDKRKSSKSSGKKK